MMALVRLSLQHARLIAISAVLLLILGGFWIRDIPVDVFPSLAPTHVSIVTPAPGMVSEQVEQLVTRPVEYATLGAEGVASVHSVSTQGISVVEVTLQTGVNAERIRDGLSARMTLANSDLPEGTGPAALAPLASDTSDILEVGLTSPHLSQAALRDIAQWTVRPRLLSTPGVSRAEIFGGEVRRIEVRARSGDLADSDLGFADVVDAVHRATSVRGAGFVDTPGQRVLVDPRGQALTADDVAAGQIHVTGGAPTRIGDVSDVSETAWPANNSALIDGRPGVLLAIGRQQATTVAAVTGKVDKVLAPLRSDLARQGVSVDTSSNRPADFIGTVVRGFAIDLLAGALLIGVLLVPLFRDVRAAAISFLTIPLTILAALAALKAFGGTLNVMTMGGLVVALGLVADDAVLDVENIIADLRDAEARHTSRAAAILLASREVRGPVIYATLIIVIALLPVIFMGNAAGALMSPLAMVIVIACLAAILVAVMVTPAFCLLLLGHLQPEPHPRWLEWIKARYRAQLEAMAGRPGLYLLAAGAILIAAFLATGFYRFNLLPPIHDGYLMVEYDAPAGTSLVAMQDYGVRLTRALKADPDVVHVHQRVGRPDFGDAANGIEHAELGLVLAPGLSIAQQDRAQIRVRSIMASFRGIQATIRTRLISQSLGTQTGSAWVRIYGDDLDADEKAAREVAGVLRGLSGAGAVKIETGGLGPVVRVDLNFQRLALYGLSAADVLSTVQTAFEGTRAAQIFDKGREIDIAVTAEANVRRDPEAVGDLLIRSSQGISAPLKYVANVYLSDGRNLIEHDNGVRRALVTFEPSGDAGAFLRAAQSEVARRVKLPAGAYLEFGSAAETGARPSLLLGAVISTLAVLGLLFILYADARASLFVLATTAFSAVGGIIVVALMGGVLSLGMLMGFLVLFGISARNAILLLSRIRDTALPAQASLSEQTVIAIALERFSPIVTSAVIVAAGLLPITLHAGRAGAEILGPMVFVILGGLVTSTLMSLIFSPIAVLWLWRARNFPAPPVSIIA